LNKWEKEVQQSLLDSEEAAIKALEAQYKAALKSINDKVKLFQADIDMLDQALEQEGLDDAARALLQSRKRAKIYQQEFQKALQSQVNSILDKMQGDNYATIDKYLKGCYETGYIGTMYDIAKQGVPIIAPINQAAVVKAVLTDSKIKEGFYNALGVSVKHLKKTITQEVSRGIASSLPYSDIARNIANVARTGLSNAKRITRTEGHRIQQTSTRDAQEAAKAKGADVVKQWDAALDSRTRDSHRRVDGEIRELDEKFSNGLMFPGDPAGGAAEVINCRCTSNTRARWALDEDELKTLQERAEYFGLDKSKQFEEYRGKFLNASETISVQEDKRSQLKNDAIDKAYFDKAEKELQGMSPQDSTADWTNVFGIDAEVSAALNAVHSDLNAHMISTHTEKAAIFSLIENAVLSSEVGNINTVDLQESFINALKKSPVNSIILAHVHPSKGSFSDEDLLFLVKYKSVKALTVELPDGSKYVMDRGTFKGGFFGYAKFDDAFNKATEEAKKLFKVFEKEGIIDLDEQLQEEVLSIWSDYEHERNKIFADILGMNYSKVTNNG
jgi:SPP1 gp7 family putative phage head morphogenesis protein